MNCRDIEKILAAYVEEIVSSEEKNLVENHLSSCQSCRRAFEELKRTVALVRSLEPVESPPWFTQKIMSRVRSEQQSKKSITQRLFHPLHIKVPLEVFATVFIAVAAVYLFKANEPEMKGRHVPSVTEQTVSKDEASKHPAELKRDTTIAEGEMILEGVPEPEKQKGVTRDKDQRTSAPRVTEAPSPPVLGMKKEVFEEHSAPSESSTPHVQAHRQPRVIPGTEQEIDRTARAPSGRAREEGKTSPPGVQSTEFTAMKPESIDLTLQTRDAKAASRDVENILNQLGARNIKKESAQTTEIFRAELHAEKAPELVEQLKLLGEVKEKGLPAEIPGRTLGIKIEVMSRP